MKKHEHSGGNRKSIEDPAVVLLRAGVKAGETLLDVGAGAGHFALEAAKIAGSAGKVYALDIDEKTVRGAEHTARESGLGNVEVIVADAVKEIPVPEASVDVCLMANVLHGFVANEEMKDVMDNVRLALKEDGRIIIVDFKKDAAPFGPPPSVRLSPAEVENIFKKYGFKIIQGFEAGPYHYSLVFVKSI